MAEYTDLKRSYLQFKKHQELNYLRLTIIHKVALSFLWVLLLPTVGCEFIFKKRKISNEVFVLEYENTEPYGTIYSRLKGDTDYKFVSLEKYFLPKIPWVFVKDMGILFKEEPFFFITNIYFLGALALKISHYNSMVQKYNITHLIVLQEYSFYSSYLTRMMEYKKGKLYNIQHGIPGETYSFFRFSKCFTWGEYYKEIYIKNQAEESQFMISGSLFHDSLCSNKDNQKEDIDILYVMQGYVGKKDDTLMILKLLESLSSRYTIRILQHPRHRVKVPYKLHEFEGKVAEAILRSHVILSRYSTAMLDAAYLGKQAVSFISNDMFLRKYVEYLPKKFIIETLEELEKRLIEQLNENKVLVLDNKYIDTTKNPIKVIENAIHENLTI